MITRSKCDAAAEYRDCMTAAANNVLNCIIGEEQTDRQTMAKG